jgi:hypothetical protein
MMAASMMAASKLDDVVQRNACQIVPTDPKKRQFEVGNSKLTSVCEAEQRLDELKLTDHSR